MNYRIKIITVVTAVLMIIVSACESDSGAKSYQADNPNLRKVTVKDFEQTSSYTYILMEEENATFWAAVTRMENIKKGQTFYFDNFMEMKDFHSKELDKTYGSIYFIQVLSEEPIASKKMVQPKKTGSNKVGDHEVEAVERVEGGITVQELYANKSDYEGKIVKIKGSVVKYTPAIMKKNWVHLQDGTKNGGDFDLTITTDLECAEGDLVVFEGKISLDKDFGYGYNYPVIMEEAKILEIEKATTLQ